MPTTIQPRFGEDAFPIGRFILSRGRELGLKRSDVVRRLGYRDLGKGHHSLSELLMTGTVPPLAAKHLASALEIDQGVVNAVILATTQQQHDTERARVLAEEEAYRQAFRPHLQVQTERQIPSPIFVAAIMRVTRLRIVQLPDDAVSASPGLRDQIIKTLIIQHYCRHRGQVPTFGAIRGYVLVLVPGYAGLDFGVVYDRHGFLSGPMRSIRRLPIATAGLQPGNDRLPGLIEIIQNAGDQISLPMARSTE